jgi:CDP-2,3-bis-(O-geranylgeranyl)-sn-glycerol synthase
MHVAAIAQLLVLLALANGTPLLVKRILGDRLDHPLDGNVTHPDGRPWLGRSKTVRGVLLSVCVTTLAAPMIGIAPEIGALVAVTAMAGDLFSSFVKRRLNRPSSSQALGLDQVPESLLPALACRGALALSALDIALVVVIFFAGGLVLSRLLFMLHLRDEPY